MCFVDFAFDYLIRFTRFIEQTHDWSTSFGVFFILYIFIIKCRKRQVSKWPVVTALAFPTNAMLFPPQTPRPRHRRNPIRGRRRFYSSFNWRYFDRKPKTVTVLNKDFDKRLRASELWRLYRTQFHGDERIANFLISLRATCRKTFTPVRDSGGITKFIRGKGTTSFPSCRVPSVSRSCFAHMARVRFRLANLHATFDIWFQRY